MKPLIVLILVFGISCLTCYLIGHGAQIYLSGRIAMAVMLLFTSLGHFKFPKGMAMMLPDFVPAKVGIIYLTGFIEIAAAIGLLLTSTYYFTGILLIIFFVLMLPSNIYGALKHVDLEKATYNGPGPAYLWFRVPLQVLFIGWVCFFAILH
jgi:uncharacterized membrane protein